MQLRGNERENVDKHESEMDDGNYFLLQRGPDSGTSLRTHLVHGLAERKNRNGD